MLKNLLSKKCKNLFQAKKCLDPSTLFHSDIDEATLRIQVTINILKKFQSTFDYFKDNLQKYFVNRRVIPWTFHPNVVFERLNKFLERLNTIQWFFKTVLEFQKLEKIEIGGMKGRVLGGQIREISAEFEAYFHGFASKSYDVLDPDDDTFNVDFKEFQENIVDLDLKLSTVLVESFDNCSTLESIFKVILLDTCLGNVNGTKKTIKNSTISSLFWYISANRNCRISFRPPFD